MIHNPTQHYLFLSYVNKVIGSPLIAMTIRDLQHGQDFRTKKRATNSTCDLTEDEAWNRLAWYVTLEHLNDRNLQMALKTAIFDDIDRELLNETLETINLPPL